jgi:hypothetical protein
MKRPRRSSRITRTVDELSDQAQQAADQTASPLADVIAATKTAMRGGVDPYLLVGVLLEAIVQILTTDVPPERRPATELATLTILQQRLARPKVACGGLSDPCNPEPEAT